jgi:hypothetical protein
VKRPARVVISYSHKDELYRDALVKALATATRAGEIEVWSDHRIVPGRHIDEEILAQLKDADAVLLLLSQDFIASDYCFKTVERHSNGKSVVLPIVARPVDLNGLPFERLKMLPRDAQAITTWTNQDEAWINVATGIREAIKDFPKVEAHQIFRSKRIVECLAENFDELTRRYSASGGSRENGFGFEELDSLIDGVTDGDFLLLAGRPNSGYAELASHFVEFTSIKFKKRILVLSQRITARKFTNRMLCACSYVSAHDLAQGQLEDEDWSRIASGIKLLRDTDIVIDDHEIRSLSDLRKRLATVDNDQYQVIVLDGLEYLTDGSSQQEKLMALALRDFSRAKGVSIICTLALGPSIDHKMIRKGNISDLAGWQCLEQISDKILFTARSELYDLSGRDFGQVSEFTVDVIKNSDGPLGEVSLRLHTSSGAVSSYPEEDEPA